MKKKYDYEEVKNFAHLLCMMVNEMLPDFTTLERNLKKRGKKNLPRLSSKQKRANHCFGVFITTKRWRKSVYAFALERSKKGLSPKQFTIFNAKDIIEKRADIFKGVLGPATNIEMCLKKMNA